MKKTTITILFFLVFILTGCSRSIVSEVTRFHNLPAANQETIEVISLHPDLQRSIEFGQYAELVGRKLGEYGYRPAQGAPSQLIARISYGMSAASESVAQDSRSTVGIGVGGGSRHTSVGVGISLPLGEKEVTYNYNRILTLDIIRRVDGVKLYEGHVTSTGKEALPVIMPYLIEALFQDFPGNSGTTNRVKIKP